MLDGCSNTPLQEAVIAEKAQWPAVMLTCCILMVITVGICFAVKPAWTRFIHKEEKIEQGENK